MMRAAQSNTTISFIIVARNAAKYLPDIFSDILAQDFPRDRMELLFVDSMSDDSSVKEAETFEAAHQDLAFTILRNPKRILASGWNVALSSAKGDVILRVDAHARIPTDFIRSNVEALERGEDIVGGQRISVIPEEAAAAFFALAETSKFGAGSAAFKNPVKNHYVDTLAHAAYRREVFLRVGGYDERLVRTEDNEIHRRMKDAGFRFYFDSRIKSYHYPRSDFRGLLRQKFSNGHSIGLTLAVSPRCFSLRHFVPLGFALALLAGVATGMFFCWTPLMVLLGVYAVGAVFFTLQAMKKVQSCRCKLLCAFLPFMFLLMHIVYGIGTAVGLMNIPAFRARYRDYKIPKPVQH